jgi:hypothetical protein
MMTMETKLERLVLEPADNDDIASVADLYVANLDVRDENVLRQAYAEVIESVPERLKSVYAAAAGLRPPNK